VSGPSVDAYLEQRGRWKRELGVLRTILLRAGLEETVKWGAPAYEADGANVAGLGAFQEHVALWFFQGALLEDPQRVLVNAQEGKTRALRQWRFRSIAEIDPKAVEAYVREAAENARKGRRVAPRRDRPVAVPPELASALRKDPDASAAFRALSPGRRREYAEHVASAKREETRTLRVRRILPRIARGEGLNDRYR